MWGVSGGAELKKREKPWRLGKEGIEEVEDYIYLGVWINKQVNGHLEGKALGLQNLARGGKLWKNEQDIKAGLTMWEVVCKPVLIMGQRSGPVPVKLMNRDWNELLLFLLCLFILSRKPNRQSVYSKGAYYSN